MWTAYIKMCVRVQKRLNEPYIAEKILTALWPPQGFRSVALSERRRLTLPLPYATWFVQFQRKKSDILLLLLFSLAIAVTNFFFLTLNQGARIGSGLHFNSAGSQGSPRLLKRREKALVIALGFSPACHKMSPDTKALVLVSAHSHSTANKCDLLFFFSLPLLKKGKKKEKLNSPLPCQLK